MTPEQVIAERAACTEAYQYYYGTLTKPKNHSNYMRAWMARAKLDYERREASEPSPKRVRNDLA